MIGTPLQAAGYDCALIGKAHFQPLRSTPEHPSLETHPLVRDLEFWRGFHGPFYGFNHVELARHHGDEAHVGQHYALWMEEKGLTDWRDHFQNRWGEFDYAGGKPEPVRQHAWTLPQEYHSNTWITERSLARLEHARDAGRPAFLWASYFDPHPPYLVPEPWASMYDPKKITVPAVSPGEHARNPALLRKTQEANPDFSAYDQFGVGNHGCRSHLHDRDALARDIATYYGMMSFLDHQVGLLLDGLERLGLAEDTLVIFTSDHGHYYGHHGLIAKGPFHYEDGIRVPFLARWPGRIPAGRESDALLSLVDVPTACLRAAGLEPSPFMQGVDPLPVWLGERESVRDHVTVEHRAQPTAIHLKTYVDSRYKLTVHLGDEDGELYDLEADPAEVNNLWRDPTAHDLRERLLRALLFAEMAQEPMPMPRVAPA